MKYFNLVSFLLLVNMLYLCSPKTIHYTYDTKDVKESSIPEEPESGEEEVDLFADFLMDSASHYISKYVDSIQSIKHFKIQDDYLLAKVVVPEMYNENGFTLNWYDQQNRFDALECIENSWMDGLNPSDYHLEKLKSLRENILNNTFLDYDEIAQFDVLLTDGLLLYSYHLLKGKIIPKTLDVNWNFSSRAIPQDPVKLFFTALKNHTITEVVHGLRPDFFMYQNYMDQLVRYLKIKENGGWERVDISRVIKPNEFSQELTPLRKRLHVTGDLEFEEGFMDSLYDEDLVNAVKKFQARHGLNSDGVIGKNTLQALNIPVEQKIDQIRINMERARWVLGEIEDNMIIVNIASYNLRYIRQGMNEYSTKVMVGNSYNKTPVFRSSMKYLVFNPTWTVPYSIATKEMLPKLRIDPNYLQDRNMTLLTSGGTALDPKNVNWDEVSASKFPYTIRQEPGIGNALGQVKFIFPNQYSVYLHDTPSKYLFDREERAFSHGCIRVQNPLQLAEVLINDTKWSQEKMEETLKSRKETIVNLKKPIDVFLLYWTCGFLNNQDIFFIKDVYQRDPDILSGLENNNWKELLEAYQIEINKGNSAR